MEHENSLSNIATEAPSVIRVSTVIEDELWGVAWPISGDATTIKYKAQGARNHQTNPTQEQP